MCVCVLTKNINILEFKINIYIFNSAVKWFITINHIQNKSYCLHNICRYTLYIYLCIYKYTNMHVYILNKYVMFIYLIYLYNINYMNINIYM